MQFKQSASTTRIVDSPTDRPLREKPISCAVCGTVYSPHLASCHTCSSIAELDKQLNPTSCITAQQGGSHYQGAIQPIEYIHSNDLNFFEGNAIKYVTRNRRKGSAIEDLKKAIHYLQLELKFNHKIDSRIEYDAVPRN